MGQRATQSGYHKGDRVRHRFGWTGTITNGRVRPSDQRIHAARDGDTPIWAALEMLEPLEADAPASSRAASAQTTTE